VVRQIGLGVLRQHKNDPVPEDDFMTKWKTAVGDTFTSSTSLQLLTVSTAFFFSSHPSPFSLIHHTQPEKLPLCIVTILF